ncbi:MAG: hypothetical protein NVSMB62_24290 [Acidobacteriaceae bacterium]
MKLRVAALALLALAVSITPHYAAGQSDEQPIRAALATFYEGWNTHDADKMVSVFAEDIDHINVFGEWHKGKESIRKELAFVHAGPLRNNHKEYAIEKIRFLTPEAAVVQVSSVSQVRSLGTNLGTYVLQKRNGTWLVVSFTNTEVHRPPWKK